MNISKIVETITHMNNEVQSLKMLDIKNLSESDTVLITIDMVNGFAKEGALYSPRIEGIIADVARYNALFKKYKKLFVKDEHTKDSLEFTKFPPHCMGEESELISELHRYQDEFSVVLPKNSTNAFVSEAFQTWFSRHGEQTNNYVIIGDCSDICIKQFAITLRAYFNELNIKNKRVIIPIDAIETYDLEVSLHNAELMNVISIYEMSISGVEMYKKIVKG